MNYINTIPSESNFSKN